MRGEAKLNRTLGFRAPRPLLTGAVHLSHFEYKTLKVLRSSKYSLLTLRSREQKPKIFLTSLLFLLPAGRQAAGGGGWESAGHFRKTLNICNQMWRVYSFCKKPTKNGKEIFGFASPLSYGTIIPHRIKTLQLLWCGYPKYGSNFQTTRTEYQTNTASP